MTDTIPGRNDRTEFLPKLLTVWREGYSLGDLKADALAGLTVAIVALPLSMAIAIASGVGPERGLYTAIVGGFLVSALGGSRYQVGGPAGAFIVLVSACMMAVGLEGLILATFLSGLVLIAAGALRLGTYIRYIPYPVTVGFTAGIAVIIFASQLREIFGLTLPGAEPGEILHKVAGALGGAGHGDPGGAGGHGGDGGDHPGPAPLAAALAGHADRGRGGLGAGGGAGIAGRDHRQPVRGAAEHAADARAAGPVAVAGGPALGA